MVDSVIIKEKSDELSEFIEESVVLFELESENKLMDVDGSAESVSENELMQVDTETEVEEKIFRKDTTLENKIPDEVISAAEDVISVANALESLGMTEAVQEVIAVAQEAINVAKEMPEAENDEKLEEVSPTENDDPASSENRGALMDRLAILMQELEEAEAAQTDVCSELTSFYKDGKLVANVNAKIRSLVNSKIPKSSPDFSRKHAHFDHRKTFRNQDLRNNFHRKRRINRFLFTFH
jgi:hypothetical protein